MTARHGPASVGGEPDALVRTSCPTDAGTILAAVEIGLYRALVRRGDTWHLRTCRNSHVNAGRYECSDPCIETQIGLSWAGIYRRQHAAGLARQAGFWETEARTG